MAADTLAMLCSCLPSQSAPHEGLVGGATGAMPISARSEAALYAHALAVLEYHAVVASADENAEAEPS